jgi:hypothetical protein
MAALGHENVRGLDVTVDDLFRVRRVQRFGNLNGDVEETVLIRSAGWR